MPGWRHSGFSAHNEVRGAAEDAEESKKLAGTMLRAPMSLEKMTYAAATGTVIYRSKMHLGLKQNFHGMLAMRALIFLFLRENRKFQHHLNFAPQPLVNAIWFG